MSERSLRQRYRREIARASRLGADQDELDEITAEWNDDPPTDDCEARSIPPAPRIRRLW